MAFCLVREESAEFLRRIKNGELSPDKLSGMSSSERRAIFSEFTGEANARSINALFESKLLLKNQQLGMINWAEKIAGLKPEVKRDLITRIERMSEVLQPETEAAFLEDLAGYKLGTKVTLEEATIISDISKRVTKAKEAMDITSDTGSASRMEYGRASIALDNYVNSLKEGANKISLKEYRENPRAAVAKIIKEGASTSKAVKASLDVSAILRQGWKVMFSRPSIWFKNSKKTFKDVVDTFGGKEVMDEVRADIFSRQNNIDGTYKKAKLDINVIEEAFPTQIQEKLPLVGRSFKAADAAFTAFSHRNRADIFDYYLEVAKKSGIDITDPIQLRGIGELSNSLTSRGKINSSADKLNTVFFSPRLLKANIDVLTAHSLTKGSTKFTRKQAAINLTKIISGTAAILTIANAINPDSVEEDPRSADFGKIKVGNTRFDVTGGMSSIVTLAARIATLESKSSITGRINKINDKSFGSSDVTDVIVDFFKNKLSPAASTIKNLLNDETFSGDKPTFFGELANLYLPLPISNYQELQNDPNSANILLAMIAEGLGISTNTYSPSVNWERSTSKELSEFKEAVGAKEFKEANEIFNTRYIEWLEIVAEDELFNSLEDDRKRSVVIKKQNELKKDVLRQFGFVFRAKRRERLPNF